MPKFPAIDITDRADDRIIYWDDTAGIHKYKDEGGGSLGAWTTYTPTLTAVTSNPVLGSSTLTGRYKALDANTYAINIYLTITTGGAWSAGSGEWKFSLPAGVTSGGTPQSIVVHMLDSGTRRFAGAAYIAAGATVVWPIAIADASGTFILSHNVPITPATGDVISISGIIEVA